MKRVYTCFCTDVIHEGHRNILREAQRYGEVTVGVLCDAEMVRYNRFPTRTLAERVHQVEVLPEVSRVIVQKEIMYDKVVAELQPDIIIHGDNWRNGPDSAIRRNVIENLARYGGRLVEVPYTYNGGCGGSSR